MKVRIIRNRLKEWAAKTACEVKNLLLSNGFEVVGRNADATICIGGDGTILFACHKGRLEGNVLGIGSRRSYICQLHKNNWKKKLLQVLKGKTEDVWALQYFAAGKRRTAINDVVVHTSDYRVLELAVSIEKEKHSFAADGIIVSSAIGSTAYAYSAGGKKLKPTSSLMQVVPIAPYRRAFMPRVVPRNETIRIKANRECALIADGIYIKKLKPNETVIIKQDGKLRFFKGVGWYEQG